MLSDIIYGLIFAPSATFKKIGEDKPVVLSLLVFLVISVINLPLYRGILLHQNTVSIMHKAQWFWIIGWMGIFFSFLVLFFLAGLYSLLSEIIFKKGNAVGILACFCFAAFPGVIGSACQYGAFCLTLQPSGFYVHFWLYYG
ncbi:YIP1 family protein [Syntrophomonas palmitatica]|uniref:YIP1 family protein n=1 Tax=Syntrophomonas palmitatica TaxID=402877 RepID=UPI0006D14E31|nr:YIP1 family protein [Syntrophomonas palmitatica]